MTIFSRFPIRSFGLAILIELALAASAAWMLALATPAPPPISEPVPLTLTETPPEPKPEPKPPTPQVIPKPKVAVRPKAAPPKPQPPAPGTPPTPQPEPAPLAQTPTAFTEPVHAAAPPPPPPPPVSGKTDRNAEYAAKVHAAVQAAVIYPPAAASMHFSDRIRVEFHLRDGVADRARVIVPSGIGMIDRAALASVQNARYPMPPDNLRGEDLVYQVWVEFAEKY